MIDFVISDSWWHFHYQHSTPELYMASCMTVCPTVLMLASQVKPNLHCCGGFWHGQPPRVTSCKGQHKCPTRSQSAPPSPPVSNPPTPLTTGRSKCQQILIHHYTNTHSTSPAHNFSPSLNLCSFHIRSWRDKFWKVQWTKKFRFIILCIRMWLRTFPLHIPIWVKYNAATGIVWTALSPPININQHKN